jgi:hypothetical protein
LAINFTIGAGDLFKKVSNSVASGHFSASGLHFIASDGDRKMSPTRLLLLAGLAIMEKSNPQIEASLEALATICCSAIGGNENGAGLERVDGLLKTLLMSGYARMDRSLEVDLENRVKEQCINSVLHRAGELSSLSAKLARQFSNLARQQSQTPNDNSLPSATGTATDARS